MPDPKRDSVSHHAAAAPGTVMQCTDSMGRAEGAGSPVAAVAAARAVARSSPEGARPEPFKPRTVFVVAS
eukprot:scaffold36310_cov118-Isochrysis_galbana.AAC.11